MMRRASLLSLALLSLNLSGCNTPTRATYDVQQGWAVYGTFEETLRSVTPELSPEILLAHPEDFVGTGELLVLDGHVAQVCLTMGCWLEIEGADQGSRVLRAAQLPRTECARDGICILASADCRNAAAPRERRR